MRSADLIRELEKAGWTLKRVRGSHHVFVHPSASRDRGRAASEARTRRRSRRRDPQAGRPLIMRYPIAIEPRTERDPSTASSFPICPARFSARRHAGGRDRRRRGGRTRVDRRARSTPAKPMSAAVARWRRFAPMPRILRRTGSSRRRHDRPGARSTIRSRTRQHHAAAPRVLRRLDDEQRAPPARRDPATIAKLARSIG